MISIRYEAVIVTSSPLKLLLVYHLSYTVKNWAWNLQNLMRYTAIALCHMKLCLMSAWLLFARKIMYTDIIWCCYPHNFVFLKYFLDHEIGNNMCKRQHRFVSLETQNIVIQKQLESRTFSCLYQDAIFLHEIMLPEWYISGVYTAENSCFTETF